MRQRPTGLAERARTMNLRKTLVITALLIAACAVSVDARAVSAVRLETQPDRVEIYASVPTGTGAYCNQSQAGKWITMDIQAPYGTKPVGRTIRSGSIYKVRAGWLRSHPPVTRISVTTTAKVPYKLERTDADTLKLTVWKSKAMHQAALKLHGSPVKPAEPAASAPAPKAVPPPAMSAAPAAAMAKPAASTVAAKPPAPRTLFASSEARPALPKTVSKPEQPVIQKVASSTEVLDVTKLKAGDMVPASATISSAGSRPVTVQPLGPTRTAFNTGHGASAASKAGDLVSLDFVGTDINDVLRALTLQAGVNVVTANDVKGEVTVALQDVSFESALDSVTKLSGYTWTQEGNTYYVASDKSMNSFRRADQTDTQTLTLTSTQARDAKSIIVAQLPSVMVTIPGGDETGRQIILQGSGEDVREAKTLIARVDSSLSPLSGDDTMEVYNVRYSSASSLIAALRALVPGVQAVAGGKPPQISMEPGDEAKKKLLYLKKLGGAGASSGAGAAVAGGETAAAGGEGGGSSKTEAESRMLVLYGTATDVSKAKDVLAKIDVPLPLVQIEAEVVDMNITDDLRKGFLYDQDSNGFTFGIITSGNDTDTVKEFTGLLSASVEAEIVKGNGKLLAHPKISVVEGEVATIFIGDTIRYIESIQATPSGVTVTTQDISAGIELGCLPMVDQKDGKITLAIHPEASTPTLVMDEKTGVTLPQIAQRLADSTLRVKDGETIVIGGLINQREINTLRKIPFLADLPFFGQFFKHRTKDVTDRDLVIFLTCRIVKD